MTTMRSPRFEGAASPPVVRNHFDAQGRVDWQEDELGRRTSFSYGVSAAGDTSITAPDGDVRVDHYVDGLRVGVTAGHGTPEAAHTEFVYDPDTYELAATIDPLDRTTSFEHDARGNRTRTVDPLGRETTATFNTFDLPLTATDAEGTTSTYTYDTAGNPMAVSRPLAGSSPAQTAGVSYGYDDPAHPGDVTTVIDARGKTWSYDYDVAGNVVAVTDPLNHTTTATHNPIGWLTSVTSARGNTPGAVAAEFTTAVTSYDPRGMVEETTDAAGNTVVQDFDANANLASRTDADSNVTTYVYDDADQLLEVHRPDQSVTGTAYWPDGTVSDQIDAAGQATHYTYDSLDRPATVTDPLGRTTTNFYDLAGNLAARQDPGGNCTATPAVGCTSYTYDVAGQLETVDYTDPATPDVTGIDYDDNGRRTAMVDGTGTSTWAWDSLGRLASHTDGAGATVGYGYDLAGNVTSIAYPNSAGTVTRAFDDAGQLSSVTDWAGNATTFGYDENGNHTDTLFPAATGNQDVYDYDNLDRLASIDYDDTTGVTATLDYQRTDTGLLAAMTQTGLEGPATDTYEYDPLDQLTTVGTGAYDHDPGDNLTQLLDGAVQAFDPANQLCFTAPSGTGTCAAPPADATTFDYDTRGNRTAERPPGGLPTTYGYDQANRLTSATVQATPTWDYAYNGDGLRTTKTHPDTTTTDYTWDTATGLPLLLAERTGTDATYYLYGPGGQPIAHIDPTGAVVYYHHDQLGSTRLLTDTTGTTIGTATYDPYGKPTHTTGTTTPLGYAGQYTDTETGLQYLRARYYDPTTAQFLTRDPLESLTRQPYAYANNTPLNFTDPMGLAPWDAVTDFVGDRVDDVVDAGRSVGNFVYENAGTLSTVASFAATGAYAFCAVSVGVGCGVGLALSATSTALSGVNAYRACFDGGGNCSGAVVSLGFSVAATGAGAVAQGRAASALYGVFNTYARNTYLWRQAGVIGGLTNGASGIVGLLSSFFPSGDSYEGAYC